MLNKTAGRSGLKLMLSLGLTALAALSVSSVLAAQEPTFDLPSLECLPLEENKVYEASVGGLEPGDSIQLYFRRLNQLGSPYYVEMLPMGGDDYWSVFLQPEDREQEKLTDGWWELLKDRDWMEGRDRAWLENFLEEQEQEAAEFFVAVYDAAGELRDRSKTLLTTVHADDCFEPLNPVQRGLADNLEVGETEESQQGKEIFHWLCEGIVTRIDLENVKRADEYCRACVFGQVETPQIDGTEVAWFDSTIQRPHGTRAAALSDAAPQ